MARVLLEPRVAIARSTGRARLRAVQRFIRIVGPELGRDSAADLSALDALLPARPPAGWHTSGVLVAGSPNRRRPIAPTLDATDLARILDAAGASAAPHCAARDRALVSLCCFTGLRVEEVVGLHWEHLNLEPTRIAGQGLTVAVQRRGRLLHLPLPGPAADALAELAAPRVTCGLAVRGPVIRTQTDSARALGYGAARKILRRACRHAGYPPVESAELRAGCAYWLRTQGLSDHEVVGVLGLARVRSLDRLLHRHAALDAQRRVREVLIQ